MSSRVWESHWKTLATPFTMSSTLKMKELIKTPHTTLDGKYISSSCLSFPSGSGFGSAGTNTTTQALPLISWMLESTSVNLFHPSLSSSPPSIRKFRSKASGSSAFSTPLLQCTAWSGTTTWIGVFSDHSIKVLSSLDQRIKWSSQRSFITLQWFLIACWDSSGWLGYSPTSMIHQSAISFTTYRCLFSCQWWPKLLEEPNGLFWELKMNSIITLRTTELFQPFLI